MSALLAASMLAAAGRPAALGADAGTLDILGFQLVGLVIVLGALTALYLASTATGWLFQRGTRSRAASARAATAGGGPSPEVVAAIAAAVAATLESQHRLVSVRPLGERALWTLEGRRALLASHHFPRSGG